jgi:hypothetical protein
MAVGTEPVVVAWSYLVQQRKEKTQNNPKKCDEEKK